jgi:hypothetical protein
MIRKIAAVLVLAFAVLQFMRPAENAANGLSKNDISLTYGMPDAVHNILVNKCYDCHSNNTAYPWYSNIQPVGWWLNKRIVEGKGHVDFSEFKTYDEKKANHKLEELSEVVTDGSMPLQSYLWLHPQARLTEQESAMINNWLELIGVTIKKPESE